MSNAIMDKNDEALMRLWDKLATTEPGTQEYNVIRQEIVALSATRIATAKEISEAASKEKSIELDTHFKEEQIKIERAKLDLERERDKKEGTRKWFEIFVPAGIYALVYGVSIAIEKWGDIIIPKVAQAVTRGIKPRK